jgi:hypothetical protein
VLLDLRGSMAIRVFKVSKVFRVKLASKGFRANKEI